MSAHRHFLLTEQDFLGTGLLSSALVGTPGDEPHFSSQVAVAVGRSFQGERGFLGPQQGPHARASIALEAWFLKGVSVGMFPTALTHVMTNEY